jgi:hypothetical protein
LRKQCIQPAAPSDDPPSIRISAPVINPEAGDAKNNAKPFISFDSATLPSGIILAIALPTTSVFRRPPPKPMTSGLHAKRRFGKQDFVYVAADDVYLCPAGEQPPYRYTNEEDGKTLRRYWTTACQACALKSKCTTGKERRISAR